MGNVFKSDQEQASHPSDLPKEVIAESNVGLVELLIQQEELTAKITIEDIILGVGSFGEIRSAILHAEDRPCAVKLIDKTKLNENMTKNLQREVSIWRTLHHENILELICVFETNEEVVLCMPKAENGDLFSLLEKTQYIGWESEEVPKNIFRQVSTLRRCVQPNYFNGNFKAPQLFFNLHNIKKKITRENYFMSNIE